MKQVSCLLLLVLLCSLSVFSFVKNVGQFAPHVLYYCDMEGYRLYVTESYLCLQTVQPFKPEKTTGNRTVDIAYVYIDLPEQARIEPM